MDAAACAVGRVGRDGPWVGFAPTLHDGYAVVVGAHDGSRRITAAADDLISLAVVYFDGALEEPPEELAATHGDIGALVRHVAEHEEDPARRRMLAEAVDALDDGLAEQVTIARLTRSLADGTEPTDRIRRLVERALDAR